MNASRESLRQGLDALVPTQHGYLSAQLGLAPREAFVRGEAGYKFTKSLGAFAFGERRFGLDDAWDAGVGWKLTF